jgi:hypothetical protein
VRTYLRLYIEFILSSLAPESVFVKLAQKLSCLALLKCISSQ